MGSSGPLYIALANRARDLQPGSVRTSLHYQAKVCGCATTKATEAPFPGVKKGTFSGTLYKNLEHTKGLKSILLLKSERKKTKICPSSRCIVQYPWVNSGGADYAGQRARTVWSGSPKNQ